MTQQNTDYIEPVSIFPALLIFNTIFLLFTFAFKVVGALINIASIFVLPISIVILLISCFYAIQFFIKKNKRYFMITELLFIIMGSVISIWLLQAILDGVMLLHQPFLESLINGSLSTLFQATPIIFAYAYLGRHMLIRFLAHQSYEEGKNRQ